MRIGIDLGGTKIEILALDSSGVELIRRRVATPGGDYPKTLDAIAGLVADVERELGRRGSIGIGSPGAISARTGLLRNSNSVVLNGKPLLQDLSQRLDRPVRIENDANCFALSEATDGAAAGADVVFGVILGTGVGGGIVVHGKVLSGHHHVGGEWGHNPLPWPSDAERPGAACYCGKSGCIETFLSGSGLVREYRRRSGEDRGAEAIAAAALNGEAAAIATLAAYQDRLARGLAVVINTIDPDVIVLGGGLSNIPPIQAGLVDLIGRYAFSDFIETRIVPARHGDSSGVRGAAWLWPDEADGR